MQKTLRAVDEKGLESSGRFLLIHLAAISKAFVSVSDTAGTLSGIDYLFNNSNVVKYNKTKQANQPIG